jgi:hypothetical protein
MDIFFSTMDRSKVIQLPVLPEEIPLFDYNFSNEEFETLEGTINLKNYKRNLFTATIESFFPSKPRKYKWLKSDLDYNNGTSFFLTRIYFKEPIRYIVIGDENEELMNVPVTIESYTTTLKRNKDVAYSLSIKEFREVI